MGDLTEVQKSTLIGRLLYGAEELYRRNDPETSDILLALWQTTGHRRAGWMYRFMRLGFSFRIWQRADSARRAAQARWAKLKEKEAS